MIKGLDLHDRFEPVWEAQGQYATDLFTEKSLDVIEKHDKGVPLFLIVSHLAAHTGKEGVELGVKNITETNEKFSYIKDPRRRLYAGTGKKIFWEIILTGKIFRCCESIRHICGPYCGKTVRKKHVGKFGYFIFFR